MILAAVILQESVLHQFIFVADSATQSMNVAGTFNSWSTTATPMSLASDGHTWSAKVRLGFGRHQYKFVRNGSEWMTDPKAERNVSDGNGNTNSELTVLPPDYNRTASKNDGILVKSVLKHEQALPFLNFDRGQLEIRLRLRAGDASVVNLVTGTGRRTPMSILSTDDLYETRRATFAWDQKAPIRYWFEIKDGTQLMRFDLKGKPFLVDSSFKPFHVPNWVEDSVFYQIFPDRFHNGSKSNDPISVMPWNGVPTYSNRFGGDVAGVRQKVGYLKSLGINAVYFNPIFKSPSNHRYEADSYLEVDPEFGSNAEYFELTRAMKAQGIRTVLDFAFNHTSPNFAQFQDIRERGKDSSYLNWYFIKGFPVRVGDQPNYEAWYGFPSMPKLNTVNPATSEFLLQVCDFWMKNSNLDGMRLDVANEVDSRFWKRMRPHVKAKNPNLWILGEIWGDGNPWLQGDQFDSVMNYQFRNAVLQFVAKGTTNSRQFLSELLRVHFSYPGQVSRNMLNLIGSHDTPRFLDECGMDDDLALMGAAIQFTWVGAPSVYYGDELGMSGGADPMNRKGMDWSRVGEQNRYLKTYRRLIQLRKSSRALRSGSVQVLSTQGTDQTGAYLRIADRDAVVVTFNRGLSEQKISFSVPSSLQKAANQGLFDIQTGSRIPVNGRVCHLTVKPKTCLVLSSNPKSHHSLDPIQALSENEVGDSAQRRANLKSRSLYTK